MRKILDFEIHSRYSRACSKLLTLPNLDAWAKRKGIDIIGTGDFTHPEWFSEIQEYLVEDGTGLLRLRSKFVLHDRPQAPSRDLRFLLSAEVSSIYSHNGKTRRIHNLLLAPSIQIVAKIRTELEKRGAKLAADGRPIVGLSSKEVLELVLGVSEDCMLIPAHVWTPYFGLFGSMSGYDSVEECFEDLSSHIYALETGLSADPEMFWRISKFDRFTLVSCSDPHSLPRIGRECNLLELEDKDLTYSEITRIIKEGDKEKFKHTLEYYPEEGRYHYDGHAECKVSLHPQETKKYKGICPVCGKKLTIGVLSRAEELADRPEGFVKENVIPGKHFVVLDEIIAAALGKRVASKQVQTEYLRMTDRHSEFDILFELHDQDLLKITSEKVREAINKMRLGQVEIVPGYDGEYGKIILFESSTESNDNQQSLFD
jgi:uncharacterized protein (TIGR00375 family)